MKKEEPPNVNPLNGNGQPKKTDLTVYLYNVIEDEWPLISAFSSPGEQSKYIENANNTADCFYLANVADEQNLVYISPVEITKDFQDYTQNLIGRKNANVIVPKSKTHLICKDLIDDKTAFNDLLKYAQNFKRIELISYTASPQLYELADELKKNGVDVYMPEAPDIDSAWTVNFFGSKSGIRQLAQKSKALEPDFMMSDGIICVGIYDAAKIAANKFIKNKGVVIKTNKGSGGTGLFIFREGDLPSIYTDCEKKITEYLKKDSFWDKFPIVIEDLININPSVGNGYPNIEYKISKSGHIEMSYYCICMVTSKGEFLGVDINDELMNERIVARIVDTGYFIAEQYSSSGYRGVFDLDMLAAKNGHIYVCESNTRNTGGTDSHKVATKLLGKDYMEDYYVISRSHYKLHTKTLLNLNKVLLLISPVLYSNITKEGVIISSENILKDKELIYLVFGKNKKRAYEIEEKMKYLLENLK